MNREKRMPRASWLQDLAKLSRPTLPMNTDTPPQPARGEPWPKIKLVGHSWSDSSIYTEGNKYLCGSSIEGDATEDNQEELEAEQTKILTRFCDTWNLLAPHPDLSAVEVHSKETMDEVRELLTSLLDWGTSQSVAISFKATCALAKLNPPL